MGKGIRLAVAAGVVAAGIGTAGGAQAQGWHLPPEVIGGHILPQLPDTDLAQICRTTPRLQEWCAAEQQRRAVRILAGTGQWGNGAQGRAATATALHNPGGVALTPDGDVLLTDWGNHRVLAFRLPPAADFTLPPAVDCASRETGSETGYCVLF